MALIAFAKGLGVGCELGQVTLQFRAVAAGVEIGEIPFRQRPELNRCGNGAIFGGARNDVLGRRRASFETPALRAPQDEVRFGCHQQSTLMLRSGLAEARARLEARRLTMQQVAAGVRSIASRPVNSAIMPPRYGADAGTENAAPALSRR